MVASILVAEDDEDENQGTPDDLVQRGLLTEQEKENLENLAANSWLYAGYTDHTK